MSDDLAKKPSASGDMEAFDDQCDEFERQWQTGENTRVEIEQHLRGWEEPDRSRLLRELVIIDVRYRSKQGDSPELKQYLDRFPSHQDMLNAVFADLRGPLTSAQEQNNHSTSTFAQWPPTRVNSEDDLPGRVGRYVVHGVLGSGGFGRVLLAQDDQLNRQVAVKLPRSEKMSAPECVEMYLDEARMVASLNHPAITPVYDVGQTADGQCFVVSKLIDGMDLARRIARNRFSPDESARLVAIVADALHYAHSQKLVHRDVKPANILLDESGQPFITDFGLALRDERFGKDGAFAGTPAYMSPEQARGEGHLVDGRSDIFSLGVVFYELLTGERPFFGETASEILDRIRSMEARPPRQIDSSIPRELERVCLKCLAKRATDRYTTAMDLASDLRSYLADDPRAADAFRSDSASGSHGNRAFHRAPQIVPKGLRSFDQEDTDFFVQMLPGPRDRDGMPESIRFWKSRIEEADEDRSFRIGFIYGPSGCGKSSFLKAGLLPRLAANVVVCYVECHAGDTEARLMRRLQRLLPGLPAGAELDDILAAVRTGACSLPGSKLLIVLDQFEQWLHSHDSRKDHRLVRALRQCDATRVQCLALVRDDFWLAVHRLSQQLEIKLSMDKNISVVDLLDEIHSRKVLAMFGRAFGRLPIESTSQSTEHAALLDQAIAGLSNDGKVAPVRLALFAEMIKGRPWLPETLTDIGGVEGVGVAFLRENLDESSSPANRLHRHAARDVLKAMLPDVTTTIRGRCRSRTELLAASGYAASPGDFDDLMRILDVEMRLLTPTETDTEADQAVSEGQREQFYQLTHDFLVPTIREWLIRGQRQTRRGRAQLLLEERTANWQRRRAVRDLPTLEEFVRVACLTDRKHWDEPQRKMIQAARRYYASRAAVLVAIVGLSVCMAWLFRNQSRATRLVRELQIASVDQLPMIVDQLQDFQYWVKPQLVAMSHQPNLDAPTTIQPADRARMALVLSDPSHLTDLGESLLDADAESFTVLSTFLMPYRERLSGKLRDILGDARANDGRRFRAACALASYGQLNSMGSSSQTLALADLIAEWQVKTIIASPDDGPRWTDALRNASQSLKRPLARIYRSPDHSVLERFYAARVLVKYAAEECQFLVDLLQDAEEGQFEIVIAALAKMNNAADLLRNRLLLVGEPLDETKERSAQRANCAVGLLRLGQSRAVWDLLDRTERPDVRTHLIHLCKRRQVDPQYFADRLIKETKPGIRQALLLILGNYEDSLDARLAPTVLSLLENDPDPGVHAASDWLLRRWNYGEQVRDVETRLRTGRNESGRRWFLTDTHRHTMVVFDPVEFVMGTQSETALPGEKPHRREIPRAFAVGNKEISIRQFGQFLREEFGVKTQHSEQSRMQSLARTLDCPHGYVRWQFAARYCNWLSSKENIPKEQLCYRVLDRDVTFSPDYLNRTGYRLPTEAEWEYACRADSSTDRFFGNSDRFMSHYVWYQNSSNDQLSPVGLLMPNDFGMFDMLGNVAEWCNDPYGVYPDTDVVIDDGQFDFESLSPDQPIDDSKARVTRGSYFSEYLRLVRSAARLYRAAKTFNAVQGFRIARTVKNR